MGPVVLGLLLLAGPQTIYALNKHFEGTIALFYRGGLGSLRAALTGLLDRGEVVFDESVEQGRNKKTYRPTQRGVEAFHTWLASPITDGDFETGALARCFFLGLAPDPATRRGVIDGIIARAEAEEAQLVRVTENLDTFEVPAEAETVFAYQRATLDYGLGSFRFAVRFFTTLRDSVTEPDTV